MATPDNTPSPLPGQQPPKGSEPRPRRVRTPREFNAQLVNLRTGKGLTLEELNKRSQGRLPKSTVSNNLNKNTLPARDFVERYVRACGGDEAEAARWLSLWQTLNAPAGPAPWRRIAGDFAGTLRSLATPRSWLPENGVRRTIAISLLVGVTAAATITTTVVLVRGSQCGTGDSTLMSCHNQECRNALNPTVLGVCFWKEPDFSGMIDVHRNPADPDQCADIPLAKSVTNLTGRARKFYSGPRCDERNLIGEVSAGGDMDVFKYGYEAGSWR